MMVMLWMVCVLMFAVVLFAVGVFFVLILYAVLGFAATRRIRVRLRGVLLRWRLSAVHAAYLGHLVFACGG